MSNIIIRAASQADLSILKEFEQGIIATERPLNDCLKSEQICYYDIGALIDAETSIVMVAQDDGVIVGSGYARLRESKAHLTHDVHVYLGFMYVAQSHRGQGVNQLVIQSLIKWGKEQGMQDF
jgi:GNAT superfamily N-acetyltransferase